MGSFLPDIHFLADIICTLSVPRPTTLLFMIQKSNFLSSEIYSQHSLLPSSNQDLHRFLALEFPLQTSKSPGMHVISFLNIIYSPVNEQHHIN